MWTHSLCYTLKDKKEMYLRSTRNSQVVITGIVGFSTFRPTVNHTVNTRYSGHWRKRRACVLKLIFQQESWKQRGYQRVQ
jgi:hypothetical protein